MTNTFKILIFSFLFIISGKLMSQENVLLDRNFWSQSPNLETVKSKVELGNDPAEMSSNAFDPVVFAILGGADKDIINYLLSFEGNDVNKKTHDGRTYIFWSANVNDTETMEKLLKNGAKLNVTDTHGNTPLTFAAGGGQTNPAIYDLFEEYGVNIKEETNDHGANALLLAAPSLKSISELDYFVSKGLSINSTDNEGNGIFNYAVRNGNIDFLQQLIKEEVEYKKLNDEGANAFLFAAYGSRGHSNTLELYEYLKGLGLDPAMVTRSGNTPLHRLASSAEPVIINFFLDNGATAAQKDGEGNTPFLNAASRNSLEVVKLLSKSVNNLASSNAGGQNALMLAVKNNSPEVVAYFLDQKINTAQIDKKGNNLAYYLFSSRSNNSVFEQKLQLLKEANVDFTAEQAEGNTIYHIVTEAGNIERLKEISGLNVDINAKNENGLTALHIAAMKAENDEILKLLIKEGANTTTKTAFDESVYDLAFENELLTKNNIDLKFLK